MPVIITRAPLSANGFGFLGTTGRNWIATLSGPSSTSIYGQSVTVDSSNYVYVCGISSPGTNSLQLEKYNTLGVIQWQVKLGTTGTGSGVATDTSGNIYVSGQNLTGANYSLLVAKYNSSGVLQWQRKLASSTSQWRATSVAVDTSGNAYIGGYTTSGANFVGQLAKYDTSGAIQWQRSLAGGSTIINGVAVDSSSNLYVCGGSNASGSYLYTVAKYNSSGAIQWQRGLGATTSAAGQGIAVDSSGNVYVCGQHTNNGTIYNLSLAKFNTSGTLQWSKSLDLSTINGTNNIFYGIAVDGSGNVCVTGQYTNFFGYASAQIARYNNSGTLLWQRTLGPASQSIPTGNGIAVDVSGNIYVCGTVLGSDRQMFLAKLPSDGSGTGTYVVGSITFAYASSALTDTTNPLTSSTTTLTDASTSYTDAAGALTESATTFTSNIQRIHG
jgi:hypothetical protein